MTPPDLVPDFIHPDDDSYDELYRVWDTNFRAESIARWNWVWMPVVDGDPEKPYFMKDKIRKKDLKNGRYGPDPTIIPDSAINQ